MKIATFDVSNSACSLAVCPNGYSMMIDCGSHSEKDCPVEQILRLKKPTGWLGHMRDHIRSTDGATYPLTTLHVTHPDLDHVKNAQAVIDNLTPYLLNRRRIEEFPQEEQNETDDYYKRNVCGRYRGDLPDEIPWGLDEDYVFSIPMREILSSEVLRPGLRNNSSRVRLLGYRGFRIMFGGDMETEGWEWLVANNHGGFADVISEGVTILAASHHGHNSGFSTALFNAMGSPGLSILSKGRESDGETDVSSRYSELSNGLTVTCLNEKQQRIRCSVSTRANGNIYVNVSEDGEPTVYIQKNL